MKCAQHPEADALGMCVSCGRTVCADCRLMLANKTYCQACADEIFANRLSITPATKGRSGLLTAGGVLAIIGGSISVLYALIIILGFVFTIIDYDSYTMSIGELIYLIVLAGLPLLVGPWEIVSGVLALKRKRFGLVLAGAFCGLLSISFVLCLLAFIFIAMSKDEFKAPRRQPT